VYSSMPKLQVCLYAAAFLLLNMGFALATGRP